MKEVLMLIFGAVSGIIGGMGMGGGTLLIPLLSIFLQFEQRNAQGLNLICFVFLSVPALIFYFKKKMIVKDNLWLIILVGVVFAIGGALVANVISQNILRICFGIFLVLLSFWQFAKLFFAKPKQSQ